MAFNEKIIEVKNLLQEVNILLATQKTALDATAASIQKYANAKMPSDFKAAQNEILLNSKKIQEQTKQQALLDREAEKTKQAKIQTQIKENQQTKSSISLNNALVASSNKLNGAFNELNNKRTQASNILKNLIASEKASNAEIRIAQKEFDRLDAKVQKANKAVGNFSSNVGNYKSALSGVGNLMGAFGIATGLYLATDIAKNIYETTKELQSMNLALKMVSETDLEFAKNKEFITEVAEKWGLEIKSLTQTYTQFYTASKGLLSDESIKTTFEGIAKAGSVMGLSLEKQQAAFYAIDQMMSKGTVTAEELKKQLGNSMPGAIKAAAMAYMELHPAIKTIQEAEKGLYADMKKGAIDSATYVPLIAKNFQILYGIESLNSVHTMQAAQNKLLNSWTKWVGGLSSSGSGLKIIVAVMESLAKNLGTVVTVLSFSVAGWLAYKTAIMLANVQARLLALTTVATTTATATQTTVTGFQTAAQIANAAATNTATTAMQRFKLALATNALGLILLALTAVVIGLSYFTKSVNETAEALKQQNDEFITNREITTELIINNKKLIEKYEELKDKTNKTKEEQKEYNDILAELSKQVPNAITSVNEYGVAVKLNSESLKKYNSELQNQLELKRKIALNKEKALIPDLQQDIKFQKDAIAELERYAKKGFKPEDQDILNSMKLKLSESQNKLRMTAARIVSLKAETQAEKDKVLADKNIKEELIKNVEWYDAQIENLKKGIPDLEDPTGKEGKKLQKEIADMQAIRDKIAGEEAKGSGSKSKKEKIYLNLKLAESEYAVQMAILESNKSELEYRLSDEKTSLDDKIKLRQEFSENAIAIMNLELEKEKAINNEKYLDELDKANKTYFDNKKNGFDNIQNYKDWVQNKADIDYKYSQDKAALDIKNGTKWDELLKANAEFYRKIQEKKLEYTQKTAALILKTQQDSFKKIADNEKYTLEFREKSFQKYLKLKKKELEVEYAIADAKIPKWDKEEKSNLLTQYLIDIEKLNTIGKEESPFVKSREEFEKYLESLTSGQINKALDDIGMSSAKMFLDLKKHIDENGKEVWTSAFQDMMKQTETFAEKFAVVFQTVGDVVQDAFNMMSEASNAHFENEYSNLERQKENTLRFAGDSESGKSEIERQYNKKKKALESKQFKEKQKLAIVNIAVDTAQAAMASWAKTGFPWAAAAAIAMGAIQIAIVSSQKMPEFWEGTENAPEGWALTQEKGQEIITDRSGKIKDMGDNKGARYTYLKAGDKVLNNEDTLDQLNFNKSYGKMLSSNNILSPIVQVSNGITREEYNEGVSRLENAIGSKPSFQFINDENGNRLFKEYQGHRTELINNRQEIKTSYV